MCQTIYNQFATVNKSYSKLDKSLSRPHKRHIARLQKKQTIKESFFQRTSVGTFIFHKIAFQ